jgi:type III pantothenate kinase
MVLAVDVGNSEITIGLSEAGKWTQYWRLSSRGDQPDLFYTIKIRDYFLEAGVPIGAVKRIVLSSVVPALTAKISGVLNGLFHCETLVLNPEVYRKLPIGILNPHEIGSDLVANAIAAFVKYKRTCVVVDFGTALTFTTISKSGKILGVSIAPGLQTAIRSLSQNTARLFEVPLEMPASALGTNTVTAIQTGILLGYEGLVKNVVSAIRAELNEDCLAVATGGLSSVITSLNLFFDRVEPKLTLDGLIIIGDLAGAGTNA